MNIKTEAGDDATESSVEERYRFATLHIEMLVRAMDRAAKGEGAPPAALVRAIAAATRRLSELRTELLPAAPKDPVGVLPAE